MTAVYGICYNERILRLCGPAAGRLQEGNPMSKTPISIIIDDSCPLIHTNYHSAWAKKNEQGQPITADGRVLESTIPNSFLDKFVTVSHRRGFKGKMSVVPMPKHVGDILNGFPGYDFSLVREWIDTLNRELAPCWDFSPEVLTHMYAIDLGTGEPTELDEETWSFQQDRTTLTPYLARALEMLKQAGIDATGMTSPWSFGLNVEPEYIAAMVEAQKQVFGRTLSWYFLHCLEAEPSSKPWIAHQDDSHTLVSIPSTMNDRMWQTIDCPRTDSEYINGIADDYLAADGQSGGILKVLDAGGWPLLCTHWQSLFSNGLETGLKALDLVGERIEKHLSDRVTWLSSMEIACLLTEGKQAQ